MFLVDLVVDRQLDVQLTQAKRERKIEKEDPGHSQFSLGLYSYVS